MPAMYPPSRSRLWWRVIPIMIALGAVGYQFLGAPQFTNPETGRTARLGLTEQQEVALGVQGFQQVVAQSKVVTSGPAYEQVRRVTTRLAQAMSDTVQFEWQVAVIDDPAQNAFCLPGGKICVYTGILPITKTDDGLAVVLGHEMAHATCHHGAERVLKQNMTQTAMLGVQGSMADLDYQQQRALMGLIGHPVALPEAAKDLPAARALGRIEQDVTWKTPDGKKVRATVSTHLFALRPLAGLETNDVALLIYEVKQDGRHRLVTAVPVEEAFAASIRAVKASEASEFKPRFNLFIDPSWVVVSQRTAGFKTAEDERRRLSGSP